MFWSLKLIMENLFFRAESLSYHLRGDFSRRQKKAGVITGF